MDRRNWFRSAFAFTAATMFTKMNLFAQQAASSPARSQAFSELTTFEQGFVAVLTTRHLNTLERWYQVENHTYGSVGDLVSSSAMSRIRQDKFAEGEAIGASLSNLLQYDQDTIVPGWSLALTLRDGRDGYLLLMRSLDRGVAFASDEVGRIFRGTPNPGAPDSPRAIDDILLAPQQIGSRKENNTFRALLGSLTLPSRPSVPGRPITSQDCVEFPCGCMCSCQEGHEPITLCRNCGCLACLWCCCPYAGLQD